jgi:hypothetical protein
MSALSTKPWEGQDLNAFGKLGDGDTAIALDSQMHHVRFRNRADATLVVSPYP